MPVIDRPVLEMTPEAVTAIIGIRAEEPDAADLALAVGITGVHNLVFTYELTFIPIVDGAADDVLQRFGELAVVVRADSVTRLEGATITVSEAGLSIDNPNSPSPKIPAGAAGLEGPVAERVRALLDTRINPAIASHGGVAELVAVEGDTVYLRLGGGCQGCGLAQVTLSQGIEVAIKDAIPEIVHVVDVTDHASGENPYFESSKK
ncbi:MAG TPA: NifU family protein [Acidimicrobiia bacterium]|nr:NifU family protein [Acidimicrobiia bacterium]